ncbi:hypothetical protein [Paenibacillus rhizoplanae]
MRVHFTVEKFVFGGMTAIVLASCIALGYSISPYMGDLWRRI